MGFAIKMIVCDLDGTLLRTDKTVSDYTLDILSRCRMAGIRIVIATARGHPEKVVPVGLFDGRILCNGAVIVAGGETYRHSIPHMEACAILLACCRRGMKVTSQFGDIHYTTSDIAAAWPDIKQWEIVDFSSHEVDAEKINIDCVTARDIAFLEQSMTDSMYLKVARDGLGMIMHKDATKSKAIARLARIWGVAQSEIAAFGDDSNDIDMLSYAGLGVAMGNALDEVKAAADFECADNDADGAAAWIEQNILRFG